MEKILLNNKQEFKDWFHVHCHFNRFENWTKIWYEANEDKNPKEYPCILVANEIEGGIQISDYWIIDFVYLSDFK